MICEHCGYEGRGQRGHYRGSVKGEHHKCPKCNELTKIIKKKTKTLHQVKKMTPEQAKELFKDCEVDFVIDKLYEYFTKPYTNDKE
jgi:hypothetical protein